MRIPSLDGLRALSILLVLVGHLDGTQGIDDRLAWLGDVAQLGVRVFFVISGFLITTLLLKEERVHLAGFYWRRFYRIFPPFYAYLLVVYAMAAAGLVASIPLSDLLYASTYTTNFQIERSWLIGHTWSLSVEEQFYLLWPGILAIAGAKRALQVAFGVVLLSPLLRVGWSYAFPTLVPLIGEAFPTVADSIATGCLLAGHRSDLHAGRHYQALLGARWIPPVLVVALFAVNAQHIHPLPFWLVGETMLNVGIAFLIDRAVTRPDTTLGTILSFGPLARLGMASYSVYLWQQIFLDRSSTSWATAFPQNLVLALLVGFASYYLVEKTIMKYRDRLMPGARPRAKLAPRGIAV